jgi:hypothetical protein
MESDIFFIKIPELRCNRISQDDFPFAFHVWRDVPFSSPEMGGCTFVDHYFPLILQF